MKGGLRDHPEHLDHPGRSLGLRSLEAGVANRLESLEGREWAFRKDELARHRPLSPGGRL